MREFEGNLLIGGAALKRVRGELAEELRPDGSHDWQFAGHLHLEPEYWPIVAFNRQYRLELSDGRSGQVVVTGVAQESDRERVVDFRHVPRKPK